MKAPVAVARDAVVSVEARVVVAMGIQAAMASLFALLTARWLGPDARGSIVLFMTTGSLLMLVGSFGVSTASRVLLNDCPPLSLLVLLSYARRLSALHVLTSASVGIFILFVSGGLASPALGVTFVSFAALQLYNYFQREALHGVGRHESALWGDVFGASLQTVVVIGLQSSGNLTLLTAGVTLVGGALAQALFLWVRLRLIGQQGRFAEWGLRDLIRYSLPAMVTTLGQALIIRGDRLVLGALAGSAAVGIYGVAATFTEMLWLIPGGVAQILFRRASVEHNGQAGARSRSVALLVTAMLCAVLASAAGFLIPALLGEEYRSAVPLTYVLIAASLPMASYQMDIATLNGLGRLKAASRITVMGSVVLLVGCLISIPALGAQGAAWSSLASYAAIALKARLDVRREALPNRRDAEEVR